MSNVTLVPGFNRELGTRLSSLYKEVGGVKAASEIVDMTAEQVSKWRHGRAKMPMFALQLLCERSQISPAWVLFGEGPMRPDAAVAAVVPDGPAVYEADDLPDGFVLLPRYEVRAAAGAGSLVHSEQIVDHLAFKHDWIVRQLRRNPAHLILIEAMGDSMFPTIDDRDLLLIDTSDAQLRDNAVYALSLNGDVVVKRLERRMNGSVLVISDNRDRYSAYELGPGEADDLRIIGQVVWHGGKL